MWIMSHQLPRGQGPNLVMAVFGGDEPAPAARGAFVLLQAAASMTTPAVTTVAAVPRRPRNRGWR
jgi:hypothetical protein